MTSVWVGPWMLDHQFSLIINLGDHFGTLDFWVSGNPDLAFGLLVTDFLFIESKARKSQEEDILGCSIILHAQITRQGIFPPKSRACYLFNREH